MEDEIIHVLMLNESAIQKPTKFQGPHWRRAGSTGFRSWFVNCAQGLGQSPCDKNKHLGQRRERHDGQDRNRTINWVFVNPGSFSTASLSPHFLTKLCFSAIASLQVVKLKSLRSKFFYAEPSRRM